MSVWNKKPSDLPERPEPVSSSPLSVSREAIPTSAHPSRRPDEVTARSGALIGKALVVTGKISGREDLVVDGRVEGDIDLQENKLTVGVGGHVQGSIRARDIVLHGAVQGNMEAAERIEIKRTARVIGDIRAARPVIEEDAYFKGNIETVRAEAPKQAPARPQTADAPEQANLPGSAPAPRPGEIRR